MKLKKVYMEKYKNILERVIDENKITDDEAETVLRICALFHNLA